MASYNNIPSNMATMPSTVNRTVGSSGFSKSSSNSRNNIVRVTGVNQQDGSIFYETLDNNTGKSYLGNPQPSIAKMLTNTISAVPKVGELVQLVSAPSIGLAYNKAQAVKEMYYQPAPIDVWQNQNNNIILDPTVPGQVNEDKMTTFDVTSYQNSLNGFI